MDDPLVGRRPPAAAVVVAVLALLLAAAVGVVVGQRTAPVATPSDPVSLGFARDMQAHHAQAVAMSEPLHRRSDDPDVARLAFDVLSTQQGQIGIMSTWLDLAEEVPDDAPMAWAGQAHDGPMPGMATPEQVAALDTLPLPQATEQYLRLMVRHHRGALPMAQHAAQHAGHPAVRLLAQGMHDAQAAEVQVLQDMLTERGLAPEPEQPADGSHHGGHG